MTNYSEFFRAVWLEVQFQRMAAAGHRVTRPSFGLAMWWVKRAGF